MFAARHKDKIAGSWRWLSRSRCRAGRLGALIAPRALVMSLAVGIALLSAMSAWGCDCGEWGVSAVNGLEVECGGTLDISLEQVANSLLLVEPDYSCDGADCGADPLSVFWKISKRNTMWSQDSGKAVSAEPAVLIPISGAGEYRIELDPKCGDKGCCEPCAFTVRILETPCRCNPERAFVLRIGGWTHVVDASECGEMIVLPRDVCAAESIELKPLLACAPEECDASFLLNAPELGVTDYWFKTAAVFPWGPLSDCATVSVLTFCDELECSPCEFGICCPPVGCACAGGQVQTQLLGGSNDDFDPSTPDPSPHLGQELEQHILDSPFNAVGFDEEEMNVAIGHTFEWQECGPITEAYLEIRLKPHPDGVGTDNDHLYLWFTETPWGNGYAGIGFDLWKGENQGPLTLCLDLADLPAHGSDLTAGWTPSGVSLLGQLESEGYLDLYVQDDTIVDYAQLTVCCEEAPCRCGHWAETPIILQTPVESVEPVLQCGETFMFSADLCELGILEIQAQYLCQPSDSPNCAVSYEIDVPAWGLHDQMTGGHYAFPIDQVDECIDICVLAFCDGEFCDECCFTLCCESDDCACDGWEAVTVNGMTFDGCDGAAVEVGLEAAQGGITIEPAYNCVGECPPDPATFFWSIDGPGVFHIDTGSATAPPIEFVPPMPGDYTVEIKPLCDGEGCCDPCYVRIHVLGCEDCGGASEVLYFGTGTNVTWTAADGTVRNALAVTSPSPYWPIDPLSVDCAANWIWINPLGRGSKETTEFTTALEIPDGYCVCSACLEIAADDEAQVWLNGEFVGAHADGNQWPPDTPSGFDEVSVFEIEPEWFSCDGNELIVAVTDEHGTKAGAIWCLQVCIQECACGDWAGVTIEAGGWKASAARNEQIVAPWDLGKLYITPEFFCEGSVAFDRATTAPCCSPTFEWTARRLDTGDEIGRGIYDPTIESGGFPVTMPKDGEVEVCILPSCCCARCEPYCFELAPCDCVPLGGYLYKDLVGWWTFEACYRERRDRYTYLEDSWADYPSHAVAVNGRVGRAINVGDTYGGSYGYQDNYSCVRDHPDHPEALDFGLGSFSIDGWIKPAHGQLGTFVDKREVSMGGPLSVRGYALSVEGGTLRVGLNDTWFDTGLAVAPGQWSYLGVAIDRGVNPQLRVFVNGSAHTFPLLAEWATADVTNGVDLWFGRDHLDTADSFGGLLDEMEIYDIAVPNSAFEAIYEAGPCGKCGREGITHEYKMHRPQSVDHEGWDVESGLLEEGQTIWLADDWVCQESGPIGYVWFAGSWRHEEVSDCLHGFHVLIASDESCAPGEILWERYFQFPEEVSVSERGGCCWQGWYAHPFRCASGGVDALCSDHTKFYVYSIELGDELLEQEQSQRYWLMLVPDTEPGCGWGWKSSLGQWFCGSVWGTLPLNGFHVGDPVPLATELRTPILSYPCAPGDATLGCGRPLDLAFRIDVGPTYVCDCDGWVDIDVNGTSASCGETVTLASSGPISIDPQYECIGEACDGVAYQWSVNGSNGMSASGTSIPIQFSAEPGECYDVRIVPYCDGTGCVPCGVTVCAGDGPCECVGWHDEMILVASEIAWSAPIVECGQRVDVPAEVCGTDILRITPQYDCSPTGAGCPSYTIEIPELGVSEAFDATYVLPLAQLDEYCEICITAWCAGEPCDECCFTLCCEGPVPCDCGGWQDRDENGTLDLAVNNGIVDSGSFLTVTAADFPLSVVPDYACQGDCSPTYECWLSNGTTLQDINGVIQLPYTSFAGPGQYGCVVKPDCSGDVCDPLRFQLVIEEQPQPCRCGDWIGDVRILLESPSGWQQPIVECGGQVELPIDVCDLGRLKMTANYRCTSSPAPGCPSFTLDAPQIGLHGVTFDGILDPFPLGEVKGSVDVCVTAWCAGVACDTCCFELRCPSACDCGEWVGVTVVGEPVACDGGISIPWTDSVLIEPEYRCEGVGCDPHYIWSVTGPSGFHLLTGGEPIHFEPEEPGAYSVTLTPRCDGRNCRSCTFRVLVDEPSGGCSCSRWGEIDINGETVTCGGRVTLPAGKVLVFDTGYTCSGTACDTRFIWEVDGPEGFHLLEGSEQIVFQPPVAGTYDVTLTPQCDGASCPACSFELVIERPVGECMCGYWTDLNGDGIGDIRIEGEFASCGGRVEIGSAELDGTVTVQPTYNCGSGCGPTFYRWAVQGSNGFSATSGDDLVRGPIEFSPGRPGSYELAVVPYCDGQPCAECSVTMVLVDEAPPHRSEYRWEFAALEGGGLKMIRRDMPSDLRRELSLAGAVDGERVSSTLPALAGFALDLEDAQGTLTGVMPGDPATYELVYELYDRLRSLVGVLHVLIAVEGEGSGTSRCTAPINLNTGVAAWTVVYPNGSGPVPAQPMLPNGNWVDSPDPTAVWVDHDGTSAGSGWVSDPLGTYEYRVSFPFDPDACCGDCVLVIQYAADDRVQFFLDTPRATYELCRLDDGCCALREEAYHELRTCSVDLCGLEDGRGTYTLRGRVENDATVTGFLVIGGVRCR